MQATAIVENAASVSVDHSDVDDVPHQSDWHVARERVRQINAGLERHAGEPSRLLDLLTELIDQANVLRHHLVDELRLRDVSWADIALPLGVSKQAAAQRYGKRSTTGVPADQRTLLDALADLDNSA